MCSRVDWVMKELGLSSNVTNSCCIMPSKAKLMTSVLCFCGSFLGLEWTIQSCHCRGESGSLALLVGEF